MTDRPNKKQKISIELDTNDLINIGNYYFNKNDYKNDYKTAFQYYEKLESYNDINDIYYNNNLLKIGYCYRKLKKYEDAIEIYKKIKQNDDSKYDYDFMKDCNLDLSLCNISKNIDIIRDLLISYCYIKLKIYEEALEYLNKIKNRQFYNIYCIVIDFIILCYNQNKDRYYNELINLYIEYNSEHYSDKYLENILNLLKKYKTQQDINTYIKNNILNNDFEYLSNCDIIDKYFIPESDDDIISISDKYFYSNNKDKLINLLDKLTNQNKLTNLHILHNIIKLISHDLKYSIQFFDIYDKISDTDKQHINQKFESVKKNFNFQILCKNNLLYSEIKYKKYYDKKNLDLINNRLSEYLFLSELFKNYKIIIDKCIVCYDELQIIRLNCHDTHILCNQCYKKVESCPMCRNKIYK